MKQDIKNSLLEYEELKLAIRERETRLAELKPIILEALEPDEVVEARFGSFTTKSRSKWTYSIETQQRAEEVAALEKREKADGTAQEIKGEPYIEYRSKD